MNAVRPHVVGMCADTGRTSTNGITHESRHARLVLRVGHVERVTIFDIGEREIGSTAQIVTGRAGAWPALTLCRLAAGVDVCAHTIVLCGIVQRIDQLRLQRLPPDPCARLLL